MTVNVGKIDRTLRIDRWAGAYRCCSRLLRACLSNGLGLDRPHPARDGSGQLVPRVHDLWR